MCVSKNTTVRASKYEPEKAMSEGKVRRVGRTGTAVASFKRTLQVTPLKEVHPCKCTSVAPRESSLQDGIISLK